MAISKLPTSASLKQVMDKFEEISLKDFSSIDIITASELPASGKEGQICIITDTEPNNIYLDYENPGLSNSDIYIKYHTIDSFETFAITSSKKSAKFKIRDIIQKKNDAEVEVFGYIYINSAWKSLIPPNLDIYINGLMSDSAGSIRILDKIGNTKITLNSTHIVGTATANASTSSGIITHTNSIDLSVYKKLYVDLSCILNRNSVNVRGSAKIGVFDSTGGVVASKNLNYIEKGDDSLVVARSVYELDINNINGEYFVGVFIDCYTSYLSNYTNKCSIYRINVGGDTLD